MVCKYKCQHNQRYCQIHNLISPAQYHRKMPYQPGGQRLIHLVLIGNEAGDPSDHISKHDSDQRYQHHIFKTDFLNKPHKNPGSQNRRHKRKHCSSKKCRLREKYQSQQNSKLGRRNRCSRSRRHKLIHTKLLHDQPCCTHSDSCTQNCQKPRNP